MLRAFHQGGKVNISISDDGRGIDPDKLKASAVGKGLITESEAAALGKREAQELIFKPGFSTAAQVTDVSGRGVGMDVVRSNLESLGGTVEIDSDVGVGTTITVKIPLTLAILAAMVVGCGEQRYAIPQANIRELVRVRKSELGERVNRIKGHEVLRLRGHLLPIVRLATLSTSGLRWTVWLGSSTRTPMRAHRIRRVRSTSSSSRAVRSCSGSSSTRRSMPKRSWPSPWGVTSRTGLSSRARPSWATERWR